MKENNQKNNAGIYLWKLIVIISAIFVIILSIECFFLIEKTVKEIIGGTSEDYSTSTTITETDTNNEENKNSIDKEQVEDSIDNSNQENKIENDNTNTILSEPTTNTVVDKDETNTVTNTTNTNTVSNTTNTTNTANTNTISNTIGNTISNTVNTNTVDTDKIKEEDDDEKDTLIKEKLVCKKIHEHLKICYLEQYTEEDRENIFAVIQMIDELPDFDTILEKLNSFEEARDDNGYSEYYLKIKEQVKHVYSYYAELKKEGKDLSAYVTNAEKLINLYNICGISDMALSTEVNAQYYAWIERVERGNPIENKGNVAYTGSNLLPDNVLAIIDTSAEMNGGQVCLPKNGTGRGNSPVNAKIQSIKNTGSNQGQMTGKISYVNELTKIYTGKKYEIDGHTNIEKLNRFDGRDAGYYKLAELWILKDGKSAESIDKNDWIVYSINEINEKGMYFTDYDSDTNSNAIHLKNGAVVRYVCDAENSSYENETLFFDYDITDGYIYETDDDADKQINKRETSTQTNNRVWYTHTKESGINSHENYLANTGNYTPTGTKLAFGNNNTGTNLGMLIWEQRLFDITYKNSLNMANVNTYNGNHSYMIATFGLTQDLRIEEIRDENNNLIETRRLINYSPGINAPFLFNNGEAQGKTVYDNMSLKFARNGDTYVLDSVLKNPTDEEKEAGAQSEEILSNLSVLEHPIGLDKGAEVIHKHIWTNNFWPMDHVTSFGGDGHDLKFGYAYSPISENRKWDAGSAFPTSDDKEDHNGYFGMQFSLDFYMVEDYEGPLEYYFFGDDDLWVYLDGKLICDLGGVHTAVGEYTNLWDYIPKGDKTKHTLAIYYTERGASGSTCWMHFNLPHPIAETTPDKDRGNLTVEKKVANLDLNQRYYFEITLISEDGVILPKRYDYITNSGRKGLVGSKGLAGGSSDDGEFFLLPGESITILGIPKDTTYTIKELRTEPHNEGDNSIPLEHFAISSVGETGTIIAKTEVKAKFTNVYNHTFAKVEKLWDDDNNSSGTRPEQITVKLTAKLPDGTDCSDYVKSVLPDTQFEVNLNPDNNWQYEWANLPRCIMTSPETAATADDEIIYTIDEIQTEEISKNYFVLSKTVRDNTTTITNAIYKNIEFTKVDTEDETKLLAGAQFKLEKLLKSEDDTDMTVDKTFEPIISKVTESDGKFSFEKLEFGRYILTEIKTPEGYNTIKRPIVINIRKNTITLTNPTSLLEEITQFQTDGKITIDLGKIGNRKGITLTETGGTGTKIFTITGLAMIVISLMLLQPKQKISFTESARQRRKKRMADKK